MKPLVGITTYTPPGDENRKYSIPAEYIDSLRDAGMEVLLLAAGDAEACLAPLDGLVLSGGGDIDPSSYDGAPHDATYMVDRERDDFEFELARLVLERSMPLLAICRGLQIVNIAAGGSLVSHVPEHYGEAVIHRAPPRNPIPHSVEVASGDSHLADSIGEGTAEIMSWHHQAVDRLGDGLRVTARASDGLIEALEPDGKGWVVAVQWHPELNAGSDRKQAALFEAFRDAALDYRKERDA
jgi:putative glutamine amidotransferase